MSKTIDAIDAYLTITRKAESYWTDAKKAVRAYQADPNLEVTLKPVARQYFDTAEMLRALAREVRSLPNKEGT